MHLCIGRARSKSPELALWATAGLSGLETHRFIDTHFYDFGFHTKAQRLHLYPQMNNFISIHRCQMGPRYSRGDAIMVLYDLCAVC